MTCFTTRRVTVAALILSTCDIAYAQNNNVSDEIIVTGSPFTRSIDDAITGQSILTGDELSDRLAATIGETLKSEPGVSSTFFGAGASRPIVRGQGGDRVRILTNGVGSIDASSASPDHAVAAEPAQAERIEVVRGASVLRYGSSGAGGIVNVIDGRIPTEVPDGFNGAIRLGASSVDNGGEAAGSLDFGLGDFGAGDLVFHIDGTYKETGNYDIPGFAESAAFRALEAEEEGEDGDGDEEEAFGTLENSQTQTSSITGGASYIGERGFIGFAVHKFDSDYGIPGGHEEEEGEEGEEEEEEEEEITIGLDLIRLDVNGALKLDGLIEKIQFFGGIADYEHTEFEGPGEVGTVFTNKGYELRLEAISREVNGWAGAYGVQLRDRDFSAIGEEAFVPPTTTNQIGLYTFQEKEFGQFHIEGAARYENTQHENSVTNEEISFNAISLSLGADVHLSENLRLGGTVFRTERAPTTEELFSNGPHLATSQFELGDVNLDKERATGIEAALRFRTEKQFLTANVFHTDYSDYVFERETGEIEDGLDVFQFMGADAKFTGFEIQAGSDLGRVGLFDVKVDGLVEFVRAQTDTENLPRIPPLSLLAGIEAETEQLNFRAELDYAAEGNDLAPFETLTEDFTLVNLFAAWKPTFDNQDVRLSVSVLNLYDSEARQHTSFLKDVAPLPGRNFRASISTKF